MSDYINTAKSFKAIGVFNNPAVAEAALRELDNSHVSLERVFVVARDLDKETELVGSELCEALRDRFDEQVNSTVRQDSGIVDSKIVISLTKVLVQLDIPRDIASTYNDLVAQGKYLVMFEGSQSDLTDARAILRGSGIQNWTMYETIAEHPEIIVVDRRDAA